MIKQALLFRTAVAVIVSLIVVIVNLRNCLSALALPLLPAAALFLSSSISSVSRDIEIDKEAPALELKAPGSDISLDSLRGRYVLVNFWSASEPASRVANIEYSRLSSTLSPDKIVFVSVNVDSDESLARQIMSHDNVAMTSSFRTFTVSSASDDLLSNYQTATGCRSFLIDPYGNIAAIPSSPSSIRI